jgi:hypothetical protein
LRRAMPRKTSTILNDGASWPYIWLMLSDSLAAVNRQLFHFYGNQSLNFLALGQLSDC